MNDKKDTVLDKMALHQHEQVVFLNDGRSGLKAIIAIHNTQLGPALGGCRMYPYATEEEAIYDVLRLARGMTYKSAVANLNFGGGKAVIIGDPKKNGTELLFRTFGRFVEGLGGRYITAEDSGTNAEFMEWVQQETRYVSGTPIYAGGYGDPSPFTTRGVFLGIKAALKRATGQENLKNIKISVQGVGHVGYLLCKELHKEGVKLYVNDVDEKALARAVKEFGATAVTAQELYGLDVDIFSPCAMGAVLNDKSIPKLKCSIVAGAANNQLANEEKHGAALREAGILYAPDYVINAGGVISCGCELTGNGLDYVWAHIEKIYDTLTHVFAISDRENITTVRAAGRIAEERLENVSLVKNFYLEGNVN